jgi:hypothetical protein
LRLLKKHAIHVQYAGHMDANEENSVGVHSLRDGVGGVRADSERNPSSRLARSLSVHAARGATDHPLFLDSIVMSD